MARLSSSPQAVLVGGAAQCAPTIQVSHEVAKAAQRVVQNQGLDVGYSVDPSRFQAADQCFYEAAPTLMRDPQRLGSPVFTVRPGASHDPMPALQAELWVKEIGHSPMVSDAPLLLKVTSLDRARAALKDVRVSSSASSQQLLAAQANVAKATLERLMDLDAKPALTDAERFERTGLRDEFLENAGPYVRSLQSRSNLSTAEAKDLHHTNGVAACVKTYSSELAAERLKAK